MIARATQRPMRPKPLMAILVGMGADGTHSALLRQGTSRPSASVAGQALGGHQIDGFLGAGDDAEPAGAARLGVRRVGGEPAVDGTLQLGENTELREVGRVDDANLEDVVRADAYAVVFAFAAAPVDHRPERAGRGAAVEAGAIGVFGG